MRSMPARGLLQDLFVQRQSGHDAFLPGVLVLKHLQALELGLAQVPELLLRCVVRRFGYANLAKHIDHRCA